MKINLAHLRERAVGGGWVNFAVFEAKSTSGDNDKLLWQLTNKARTSGLRIDQSALAFMSGGRVRFYGDQKLVNYLAKTWHPFWTHTIDY
ncbi:hypothetical protein ABRP92_04010 [Pectobacterium aroidearum]|uniref:hypothetical protein n=1 Tax=Pectobacterium aroidearum TaxID=1201031 RepID=UPI0032EBCFAF